MIIIKKIIYITLFCSTFLFLNIFILKNDTNNFAKIPILNDGRVKTLNCFLKSHLHDILNVKLIELPNIFAKIIFDFDIFSDLTLFKIINQNLLLNFDIKLTDNNLYSFNNIMIGLFKNIDTINILLKMNYFDLNDTQKQMLNLYNKINLILNFKTQFHLFNSISKTGYTNYDKIIANKNNANFYNNNKDINNIFYIVKINKINWIDFNTQLNLNDTTLLENLNIINNMAKTFRNKDDVSWNAACTCYLNLIKQQLSIHDRVLIYFEHLYSKINLVQLAFYIYILSFMIYVYMLVCKHLWRYFNTVFNYSFYVGILFSIFDIFVRFIISGRPPVTNLYESIIFVNVIYSICLLIYIEKFKYKFNLLIPLFFLLIFQCIAYNYNYGDEIKNLTSVLNTSFWLVTHVITITIGYALCLIVSILAHVYFFYKFFSVNINKNFIFFKILNFLTIIALVFIIFGTILGGVWADQSWGRFWGWDPKENGAMLVVLWLILVLHLKIVNKNDIWFSVGLIFTSIIVLLSWFGVNMLNVGLHSYGFTDKIGLWLLLFAGFECLYVFLILILFKNKIYLHY